MKGAAGIIAAERVLARRFAPPLRRRSDGNSQPLRPVSSTNEREITKRGVGGTGAANDEVKIVYTGAIYEAHYDAFRNLLGGHRALGRARRQPAPVLGSPVDWERERIRGALVHHGHREAAEVPGIQRRPTYSSSRSPSARHTRQ